MKIPLWLALNQQWLSERRGITGLTIPFLVGAIHRVVAPAKFNEPPEERDLAALLYSMQRECPAQSYVRIAECWQIHQPVAQVRTQTETLDVNERILAKLGSGSLYVSTNDYRHDQTLESVVEALWDKVGQSIAAGRYSYSDQKYHEFTETDLAFIERARNAC